MSSSSKIFLVCLLSFIGGVVLSNFFRLDSFIVFCLILAALILLIIFWRQKKWRPIILWGVFLLLGIWRFQVAQPDYADPSKIYFYNNQQVRFSGVAVEVEEKIKGQKIVVKADRLKGKKISGQVLINAGLYPKYFYGDYLAVDCLLKKPENFSATGAVSASGTGPASGWDYEKYLARYDIYSICAFANVSLLPLKKGVAKQRAGATPSAAKGRVDECDPGSIQRCPGTVGRGLWYPAMEFKAEILNFKNKLLTDLSRSINEPQVSILQAMVLGYRAGIPPELLAKFANTGISHIIAISGMNITIIVAVMMYLLINFGLRRQKAFWLASAGILIFVVMIGDQASAWRAAIMGIIFLYAQKIGRLNNSLNAILLAAAIMLLVNPKLLLSDIGFQLSFMAILGLIYIMPILEKRLERISNRGQLKIIIITTLAAQIMTLPLIIFYFHKWSLVAILANALILPLVPFLTIWGLANALAAAIYLPLGQIMGFVSWLGVGYILRIVDWCLKIPFAYWDNIYFNIFFVLILYVLIFWWVSCQSNSGNKQKMI